MSKTIAIPDYIKQEEAKITITLSRPAKISGAELNQLTMREPLTEDMEMMQKMEGSDATKEINTFANLTEQSPQDIRKLPYKDYKRLQLAFELFTI